MENDKNKHGSSGNPSKEETTEKEKTMGKSTIVWDDKDEEDKTLNA